MVALDAATGEKRWEVGVEGDARPTIAADGRLYLGTGLGVLAALGEAPD